MDVLAGIVISAVVAAFVTWILMDNANDRRWNREHSMSDDREAELIRGMSMDQIEPDEHRVTLRVLWTGDASLGVEIIDDHIDLLMTDLLARRSIIDPSIEQTSKVRRPE